MDFPGTMVQLHFMGPKELGALSHPGLGLLVSILGIPPVGGSWESDLLWTMKIDEVSRLVNSISMLGGYPPVIKFHEISYGKVT